MNPIINLQVDPEGDSCIIIRLQLNESAQEKTLAPIDSTLNQLAVHLAQAIQADRGASLPLGIIEAIPGFDTVGIYYNLDILAPLVYSTDSIEANQESVFRLLSRQLHSFAQKQLAAIEPDSLNLSRGKLVEIPVCYDPEFGLDLGFISEQTGLSIEQIIQLHTQEPVRVFMLGFSPGLPYLGLFDPALDVPRQQQPRIQLTAGSVGIANRQGVIYPFATPGGWQIVGRTPVPLFNAEHAPHTLYKPGDRIQFRAINRTEYLELRQRYEHSR